MRSLLGTNQLFPVLGSWSRKNSEGPQRTHTWHFLYIVNKSVFPSTRESVLFLLFLFSTRPNFSEFEESSVNCQSCLGRFFSDYQAAKQFQTLLGMSLSTGFHLEPRHQRRMRISKSKYGSLLTTQKEHRATSSWHALSHSYGQKIVFES